MLNKKGFVLLAGDPERWDDELAAECMVSGGTYLPQAQEVQFQKGRRHAELIRSMYGWYVRSGTGLEGFAIMYTPNQGVADRGFLDAFMWGCVWAEEDPENREFYVRRSELSDKAEEILGGFRFLSHMYCQAHDWLKSLAGKNCDDRRRAK